MGLLRDNPRLAILHTRAQVLSVMAGSVLSEFETDLIAEIARRRAAFGDLATVTEAEAAVLELAVQGMEVGIRRAFAASAVRVNRLAVAFATEIRLSLGKGGLGLRAFPTHPGGAAAGFPDVQPQPAAKRTEVTC